MLKHSSHSIHFISIENQFDTIFDLIFVHYVTRGCVCFRVCVCQSGMENFRDSLLKFSWKYYLLSISKAINLWNAHVENPPKIYYLYHSISK